MSCLLAVGLPHAALAQEVRPNQRVEVIHTHIQETWRRLNTHPWLFGVLDMPVAPVRWEDLIEIEADALTPAQPPLDPSAPVIRISGQ